MEKDSQIDIARLLQDFSARLPHFPDGRIDYSKSDQAPVLTCFICWNGKILLLKRSDRVGNYRSLWNSVAGYIDEPVPLEKKIYEELREELGISEDMVCAIRIGNTYEFYDQGIDRTWIIVPCLATLQTEPTIRLDWEHTDFRWIAPEELSGFPIVPGLERSLGAVWPE
jgi:8-oxo-dGTP pyrophosphatase MutT (NUDIX family)